MSKLSRTSASIAQEISTTSVPEDSLAFWSLGQSGIVLKGKGNDGYVCIDPYLSYSIEKNDPETEFKRAFPPVMEPEDLSGINGVLVTHAHDDHLDLTTLDEIGRVSDKTKFAIPSPAVSMLGQICVSQDKIIPVKNETAFQIKGFKIEPIAVAHVQYEIVGKDSQYIGYCIEVNGVKIFHSGDTVVTTALVEKIADFAPDIVFLPINGADYFRTARGIAGNMSFREAVDFSKKVNADMLIPVHYDMFPNNRENPAYFVDYLFQSSPTQKFHMMTPGERFTYFK
ncbi:MBL fold metallo-hydrolase [Virgibacillus sp. DJP39]|uniref:MBL fold metallo-hydrolase n=1 Tax=Virgibacillus sp. DJP39 TaxID=3409790 RepID=UPI003BB6FE48